jgi:hypothetical protein
MKKDQNEAARLAFFVERGMLRAIPSRWQLRAGCLVMLPFVLNETAVERQTNRRTLLGQVPLRVPLQLLYCPSQARVGTGLSASCQSIVRHLLSAFHDDAVITYDLQLLQTHEGGLEQLAHAADAVATCRHPLWWPLSQVVGGLGYHAHLVDLATQARSFRYPTVCADPRFSSLVGFAEFCLTLPDWPPSGFYGFDWQTYRRGY